MAKYTITYIVNENDEKSYCYADSKERAKKIVQRMVDGNYHFVKVEKNSCSLWATFFIRS